MENKFEFYPYKASEGIVTLCLIISPICLILIGLLEVKDVSSIIFLITSSILLLVGAKQEYDIAQTVIILDDEGFEIKGKPQNCYPKTKWEDVRYGQYAHDYKRHTYLVLSTRYITKEAADKLSTRQMFTRHVVNKGVPVIQVDDSKTSEELRKAVEDKIHIIPLKHYW